MKIDHAIETENGTVNIQGSLDEKELSLVIAVGLNYLFQQGAIPFISSDKVEGNTVTPGNETVQ